MKTSDNIQMNEKNTLYESMKKLESKREKEKLRNLWLNYNSFRDTEVTRDNSRGELEACGINCFYTPVDEFIKKLTK